MKYYKSEDKLIQFNPETNVYKLRNTIAKEDTRVSKEDFDKLKTKQIKKDKFCELMNIFFRDIKHEWVYDRSNFRKLDNFDKNANSSGCTWNQIPSHDLGNSYYLNHLRFVYHWGKVYYLLYDGNYAPRGQLLDTKTLESVRWVHIKNVAPIFNINKKQII